MAKFAEHVVLMRDYTAVTFKPGDDLPEWAIGLVGDHCLVPVTTTEPDDEPDFSHAGVSEPDTEGEDEVSGDPADQEAEDSEDEESDAPAADETPDFTAPAAPRRGRPRKNS